MKCIFNPKSFFPYRRRWVGRESSHPRRGGVNSLVPPFSVIPLYSRIFFQKCTTQHFKSIHPHFAHSLGFLGRGALVVDACSTTGDRMADKSPQRASKPAVQPFTPKRHPQSITRSPGSRPFCHRFPISSEHTAFNTTQGGTTAVSWCPVSFQAQNKQPSVSPQRPPVKP